MKAKRYISLVFFIVLLLGQKSAAQCFQIKSILVDACGGTEGFNEMVRFETGSTSFNANSLTVIWPNNAWQGIVQNGTTAGLTATFNANILAAGGCGQLIEPPGGIVPPNATVILFTSYNVDVAANGFGALNGTIYVLYQNNGTTSTGHFANTGSGVRTLSMIAGACVDTVSYDRGDLTGGNGAAVNYTDSDIPSYINNGCMAPVPPFTVDAGLPATTCAGSTISLSGNAEGYDSVSWSASSGTFADNTSLSTNYTIDAAASGTITLTLSATNACGTTIQDTVTITVTAATTPNFPTTLTICSGNAVPALATVSPNGISGSWNPATINNTTSGNYIFTPNTGQCASNLTLVVTVTSMIVPDFATTLTICSGNAVPALATVSPNGIGGTWNPSTINNTTSGNYIFTPNAGQCASNVTLAVAVTNTIVPDFATTLSICSGNAVPALATVSPNGISGSWNPSTINNTTSGNYIFTPNAGQCASNVTLVVTVTNTIVPDFATTLSICSGGIVPTLATVSPNGISGSWNPATINNTTSGNYIFTPNAGQCASNVTLVVTVTNTIVPDFATTLSICSGNAVPALATVSPNGISGSWNPSTINNTTSGNYIFTPNAGQCASNVTLAVTVTSSIVPDFPTTLSICSGNAVPTLNNTSPNGVTGSWNPATISNTTSGNYIFTPGAGQCTAEVTLHVSVTNSVTPIVAFTYPTPVCNNSAPIIPSGGFTAGGQFTSDSGLSINAVTGQINVAASTAGSHTITYEILPSGLCGLGAQHSFTVIIDAVITPVLSGNNALCIGGSSSLSADIAGGVWQSSNTSVATVDSSGNAMAIASGQAIISYGIGGSCPTSAAMTVTVYNRETPSLDGGHICVDPVTNAPISTLLLHSGIPSANHAFAWTLNGDLLPTTANHHIATEPGSYEVTVTNLLTGCTAAASATVGTSSIAIVDATVGADFENNQTITVTVTGGSGDYEYQLNDGPFQDSNIFTNISQGEYTIIVRDKHLCGELPLTVYALNYPHFFTPNADGYNDFWNIKGLSQQNATLYIFDRYGKLLKQIKPAENMGWDGTYNGEPLPSSDYWFTLYYQNRQGNPKEFKAHFSLKR